MATTGGARLGGHGVGGTRGVAWHGMGGMVWHGGHGVAHPTPIPRPTPILNLHPDLSPNLQVEALLELVRLRAWVGKVAALVQLLRDVHLSQG